MTKAPNNTRAVTQGALFASLTVVLVLAGYLFPPLQLFFFALPVPIAIATLISGLGTGMTAGIVAGLLAGLVTRTPLASVEVIAAGATGMAIGHALRLRLPAAKALTLSAVVGAVAQALYHLFELWLAGYLDFNKLWQENLKTALSVSRRMAKFMGTTDPKAVEAQIQSMVKLLKMVLPSTILLALVFGGIINFFLARAAAKRMGLDVGPGFPPFREWRFPKWMAWGYIISLAGMQLTGTIGGLGPIPQVVFLNAYAVLFLVFMVQGYAVGWHLFDRLHVDSFGRWVLAIIVYITGIGAQIVSFVGLLDVWFDYRKPREGAK